MMYSKNKQCYRFFFFDRYSFEVMSIESCLNYDENVQVQAFVVSELLLEILSDRTVTDIHLLKQN
jgi:hypothetical protein